MRHGREVRPGNVTLKNCKSVENEVAYWIGPGSVVKNSVGNAKYGPLLYLEGGGSKIDLGLLPDTADRTVKVHGLATIHGSNHTIRIRPNGGQRPSPVPIILGWSQPMAGENMAPYFRCVNVIGMSGKPLKRCPGFRSIPWKGKSKGGLRRQHKNSIFSRLHCE